MANFTPVGVELTVKGAGKFNSTLSKASGSIAGFGKAAVKTAALGAAAIGAAAIGIGVASVKMAVSWESAFAGVKKTVDTTDKELGELEQSLRDVAKVTPVDVEDLAAIAELGGQLGIVDDTTEDVSGTLTEFTKVIAAMGVATNLSTEEAAVGFAQIANVMGTASDEVSNMGSSVVALGNTLATNERDVLSFAQRIAGTGQVAGLTEADIFGISAAFSSVGIQAQAGGTAVSKVFLDMNQAAIEGGETMEIFAAVTGIEAGNFGAAWEEDAGAVFGEFVKGLGLAGDDATAILEELGIADSQAIRAFLSLAGAGDLVTEALETSSEAYAENTALAAEAAQRYATTESQFKIFKNTIKDVGITIGKALLPAMNKVLEFGLKIANAVGDLAKVFGERGIKDFFTTFEDGSSVLSGFFEKLGLGEKPARKIADVINTIAQVLIKNIPKAVKIATKFWSGTLLPALKNFGKFVKKTIIPAVKDIVEWLSENIPAAIATATEFWEGTLLPALEKFGDFVEGTIIPAIKKIISWLSGNFQTVLVAVGAIVVAVFVAWAISAATAAIATIAALAPIVIPLAAIGAAVFLLKKAWDENFGGIQEKTKAVIDAIKPIISEISGFILEMFGKVIDWVEENWPLIQEAISDTMNTISTIISTVLGAIVDFWNTHGEKIMEFVEDAWGFIKGLIDTVINVILGIIKTVLQLIAGDWEGAWETIKDVAEDVWTRISDTIENWINTAKDIIEKVVSSIKSWLSDRWEDIKAKVSEVWEAIKSVIETKINTIKTNLQTKMGEIKTNIEDKWAEIKQAIADKWEEIKATISTKIGDIIQNIKDTGKKFYDAGVGIIIELWNGLRNKIAEVIAWFRGKIDEIIDMFPWSSPPKDKSSPLVHLVAGGEGIVNNLIEGMENAAPKLKAVAEAIARIIPDTIIPAVKQLVDWLEVNIPRAMDKVQSHWNSVLKPTFNTLWQYVQNPVITWVERLFDWLDTSIPSAFDQVQTSWKNILKPTLQAIRDFIEDPLLAKIKEFVDWIQEDLIDAWKALETWWKNNGEALIALMAGGIGQITQDVRSLIAALNDAIAKLRELQGLRNAGGASSTSTTGTTGASSVTAPAAAMGSAAASFGNTLNLTINPTINSEMDMVTFEQRVKRVVTDSVSE